MPRTITVPVFIGVLKASADRPEPEIRTVVSDTPRGGRDFDKFRWFRSTVDITVPDEATTVPSTPAVPVPPP
jgi:hypothetical protein